MPRAYRTSHDHTDRTRYDTSKVCRCVDRCACARCVSVCERGGFLIIYTTYHACSHSLPDIYVCADHAVWGLCGVPPITTGHGTRSRTGTRNRKQLASSHSIRNLDRTSHDHEAPPTGTRPEPGQPGRHRSPRPGLSLGYGRCRCEGVRAYRAQSRSCTRTVRLTAFVTPSWYL